MAKYTRPTGRRNTGRAKDHRGDMPLPKAAPQVRAANQNGHPRPKNLEADDNARRDYFGSNAAKWQAPTHKPFVSMFDDAAETKPKNAPLFHMPMSRSWGSAKDGWTRVSMGSDEQADAEMIGNKHGGQVLNSKGRLVPRKDGFVMGQRVGRFCPDCNIALPVGSAVCVECS